MDAGAEPEKPLIIADFVTLIRADRRTAMLRGIFPELESGILAGAN